jgi:aldose 1-epimerase
MVRMTVSVPCAALAVLVGLAAGGAENVRAAKETIKMETRDFGKMPDGKTVLEFVFTTAGGMKVGIIPYGGIVTQVQVPDRDGKVDDVALACDDLEGYLGGNPFFGCLVGRYANRIAKGKFKLDDTAYTLAINNPPNTLHGGKKGFDKVLWDVVSKGTGDGKGWVKLKYVSPDGEEGYPGTLTAVVTYTITNDNELRIDYEAKTDKKTVVNLTNHTYFNLRGLHNKELTTILGHEMTMMAKRYTPSDDTLIPTGEIKDVAGTPYDFTKPEKIGARIDQLKGDPAKKDPGGYDLNYVLDSGGKELALATRVYDPETGRVLEALTTEPGMQFYTGNFLDGTVKGKGVVYKKHYGFCLEAEHFPDSPNKPKFPSTELTPEKEYRQTTIYRFSTK